MFNTLSTFSEIQIEHGGVTNSPTVKSRCFMSTSLLFMVIVCSVFVLSRWTQLQYLPIFQGKDPDVSWLPSGKRLQKTMENHHASWENSLSMGDFQ